MSRKPSKGKLLYHITHVNNIESILRHGLLSRRQLEAYNIKVCKDIADQEILNKRDKYELSKYIPFHFYAKNPFDGAVCKKYGSNNMVIITIYRSFACKCKFPIIPSHPLDGNTPEIYEYEEGYKRIRWDILDREQGRDYRDPEIKKACMAECITESKIEIENFAFIYTYNKETIVYINKLLNGNKVNVEDNESMFP